MGEEEAEEEKPIVKLVRKKKEARSDRMHWKEQLLMKYRTLEEREALSYVSGKMPDA